MSELPITQISSKPGVIDLGMGNPDFNLLPVDLLYQSAADFFKNNDPRPLQYGLEQGDSYFRQSLAGFLEEGYGFPVDPALLFVTAGASSAIDLFCSLYTQPGEVVFVEEPSYFLALRIFEDHGLQVVPIPMDSDGLRIDVLEQLLTEYHPKLVYTIPVFQNPSGKTLSSERRHRLVELAHRDDFLVLADEAYQFLPYSMAAPAPFEEYASDVRQVVSINSFSKILAPGLRLGWIQANSTVIERLSGCGLLESGGGMNPYTSALVRGLIESGDLQQNITHLRREYAQRLEAMDRALCEHLPQAKYEKPAGGFFFWVKIPGFDAAELRRKAPEFKVDFRPGILFSSQDGLLDNMRLGFSFYKPKEIEEGIRRLSSCLKD